MEWMKGGYQADTRGSMMRLVPAFSGRKNKGYVIIKLAALKCCALQDHDMCKANWVCSM
jgi:hypothetical protein